MPARPPIRTTKRGHGYATDSREQDRTTAADGRARATVAVEEDVYVVLSAISATSKGAGTTSRLLAAAELVVAPQSTASGYKTIVDEVLDLHLQTAREALEDDALYAAVEAELRHECVQLGVFLEAAQVIGELSTRSRDAVIAVGETLACRLFVAVLRSIGVNAVMVNLGRVVAKAFDPKHLNQDFYGYLRNAIVDLVHTATNVGGARPVPVITGYFGFVPGGIIETVGRGYTDFTASLIAAGVNAHELQIWKQVDGIFSADPSRVPSARLLPQISPAEAAELTYYGAEVIHPFTMEQAIQASVPIRIKNTDKPGSNGTVILPDIQSGPQSPPSRAMPAHTHVNGQAHPASADDADHAAKRAKVPAARVATAVTVKGPLWVVNLKSNRKALAHGFLEDTFAVLNRHSVVVDLIATSEDASGSTAVQVTVSMAISPSSDRKLLQALEELRTLGTVSAQVDMAIISLVGRQMKHGIGIAAKMFAALADEGINIEMISQGGSEINISCVISHHHANVALNAVHRRLIET